MEGIHRTAALVGEEMLDLILDALFSLYNSWIISRNLRERPSSEVIVDSIWKNEITIAQTLHQS